MKAIEKTDRAVKSDITHDRDANGQQFTGQNPDQHREPMSLEQLEKFIAHLESLPAFKEHKWYVEIEKDNKGFVAVVKDNLDNVIRRIPESELWTLPSADEKKGQLLKRTA